MARGSEYARKSERLLSAAGERKKMVLHELAQHFLRVGLTNTKTPSICVLTRAQVPIGDRSNRGEKALLAASERFLLMPY